MNYYWPYKTLICSPLNLDHPIEYIGPISANAQISENVITD